MLTVSFHKKKKKISCHANLHKGVIYSTQQSKEIGSR